jgi:hypothetical protein
MRILAVLLALASSPALAFPAVNNCRLCGCCPAAPMPSVHAVKAVQHKHPG